MRRVCIIILVMSALLASGCINEDEKVGAASVPTENLPEGFKLLAVLNDSTSGVNMTSEINEFYGDQDIGEVVATVGVYQWGQWGDYDARVTLISCKDVSHANAAVSNYLSQKKYKNPPFKGVERFSVAMVNGREVTEVRDSVGEEIRYKYVWNNESLVVLVEGNMDRAKSIELASATNL
jgi:hypothetical protein